MNDGIVNKPPVSWKDDEEGEQILPPNNNNPIYQSLSDKTKKFIKEVEQDSISLYDVLEQVAFLLEGKVSEEDFLKHFYGKYRPVKVNYMNEEK